MAVDRETDAGMTAAEMIEALGWPVPAAAIADLETLRLALIERNAVMNLVGPATLAHYWSRHVLDSAQLILQAPKARRWADIGAGAGFPGLVLAILLKHAAADPDESSSDGEGRTRVFLIDSLSKRCVFLSEMVTALGLPAEVVNARAETLRLSVDIVTARAVAPFNRLFPWVEHLFNAGAEGLFLKGENVENELAEASKTWRFEAQLHPSLSDPRGRIAQIRRLHRVR